MFVCYRISPLKIFFMKIIPIFKCIKSIHLFLLLILFVHIKWAVLLIHNTVVRCQHSASCGECRAKSCSSSSSLAGKQVCKQQPPVGELVAHLLPAGGREPPAIRDRARTSPWRGRCVGLCREGQRAHKDIRVASEAEVRAPERGARWGTLAWWGASAPPITPLTDLRLWACVLNAG